MMSWWLQNWRTVNRRSSDHLWIIYRVSSPVINITVVHCSWLDRKYPQF